MKIDWIEYGAQIRDEVEVAGYGLRDRTPGVSPQMTQAVCELCDQVITVDIGDMQKQWRLTRLDDRTAFFQINKEKLGRIRFHFSVYLLDDEAFAYFLRAGDRNLLKIFRLLYVNKKLFLRTGDWNPERLSELLCVDTGDTQTKSIKEHPNFDQLAQALLFGAQASETGNCKIVLQLSQEEQMAAMNWLLTVLPTGLAARLRAFASASDFRQTKGSALVFMRPEVFETCSRDGAENASVSTYRDGRLNLGVGNNSEQLLNSVKAMWSYPEERWEAARTEFFVTDWQSFRLLLQREPKPPIPETTLSEPLFPESTFPEQQILQLADTPPSNRIYRKIQPLPQDDPAPAEQMYLLSKKEKQKKEKDRKKNEKTKDPETPERQKTDRQEKEARAGGTPFVSRLLAALTALLALLGFFLLLISRASRIISGLNITLTWSGSDPAREFLAFVLGGVFACSLYKAWKRRS